MHNNGAPNGAFGKYHQCQPMLDCLISIFTALCKMLDPKMFEDFTQRVSSLIANSPAAEVEKNMRAMMSSFFSKLNLVTREEFDTQANVLARTRQLVEQLSARLDELEAQDKKPQ